MSSTQEKLEEFLELFATKPYNRARENLITLIKEARIDELYHIRERCDCWTNSDNTNLEYDVTEEYITKRIKKIRKESE